MPEVEYCPIAAINFHDFTRAFNRAYRDYHVPIIMTADAFQALIARDDLDLHASVAALDGNTIIGTGLLGIRSDQGWIGGMGVIPERRRQGIGREMMRYLIDRARERGLSTLYLEVIEANHGAHALYRQLGFVDTRMLHIMSRKPQAMPDIHAALSVSETGAAEVLKYYPAFHDTPNCWQRDHRSLTGLASHAQGIAAQSTNGVIGYALGWFEPYDVRIADLATAPGCETSRPTIAAALLDYLHRQYPRAVGSVYNVAEDDPAFPAYQRAGYTTDYRQIEMRLPLFASPNS